MKLVVSLLVFSLMALGAHAAAAPYNCKAASQPAYLVSFGPMGQNTYLKVGKNETELHHPLMSQAGPTPDGADKFVLYNCYAHNSRLPKNFSLVRLDKDRGQCLSLNGKGPKKGDDTPASQLDILSNSLVLKPCASTVQDKIFHQIFKDENESDFPMVLKQQGTGDYATRAVVSFRHDHVELTPQVPPKPGSPSFITYLYLNDE